MTITELKDQLDTILVQDRIRTLGRHIAAMRRDMELPIDDASIKGAIYAHLTNIQYILLEINAVRKLSDIRSNPELLTMYSNTLAELHRLDRLPDFAATWDILDNIAELLTKDPGE